MVVAVLLHHVHLLVPDVPAAEGEYAGSGFAELAGWRLEPAI
jgi:hypothetical protein